MTHLDQHLKREKYTAPLSINQIINNFGTSGAGLQAALDDNTFGLYGLIYELASGDDFDKFIEEEKKANPTAFATGQGLGEAISLALGPGLIGKAGRLLSWVGKRTAQTIGHTRARTWNKLVRDTAPASGHWKDIAKKLKVPLKDVELIKKASANMNSIELNAIRQRIAQNADLSKWGLQNFLGTKASRLAKRNAFNEWKTQQLGLGNKLAAVLKNPWDNPVVKYGKGNRYIPEWIRPHADDEWIGQLLNFAKQTTLDSLKEIAPFLGEQITSAFYIQKKAEENYLRQGLSQKTAEEWAWAYTWGRLKDTALASAIGTLPYMDTAARGLEIYHSVKDFDQEGLLLPPSQIKEKTPGYALGGFVQEPKSLIARAKNKAGAMMAAQEAPIGTSPMNSLIGSPDNKQLTNTLIAGGM